MKVFRLREELIREYSDFVRSFLDIHDKRIREHMALALDRGRLWPEPLLNPLEDLNDGIDAPTGEELTPA